MNFQFPESVLTESTLSSYGVQGPPIPNQKAGWASPVAACRRNREIPIDVVSVEHSQTHDPTHKMEVRQVVLQGAAENTSVRKLTAGWTGVFLQASQETRPTGRKLNQ